MAATEEHTWAPPLAAPAQPPSLDDRVAFVEEYGLDQEKVGMSEFTKLGYWDVDDVLRPIFQEASEMLGREFPYPGDE
jgi:ribonuclease Z